MRTSSFILWSILVIAVGVIYRRLHSAASSPVPSIRQEVYTLWHFDGRQIGGIDYRFEISSGSCILRYESPYGGGGTSYYSGRWSGDCFIARQRDTTVRIGCDTVWMYPGCGRIDMYTR